MIVANKSDRSPKSVRSCGHFTYSDFQSYKVHLSPLIACGEGVGGWVLVPGLMTICCIQKYLIIAGVRSQESGVRRKKEEGREGFANEFSNLSSYF
jgi:hypothetical protein